MCQLLPSGLSQVDIRVGARVFGGRTAGRGWEGGETQEFLMMSSLDVRDNVKHWGRGRGEIMTYSSLQSRYVKNQLQLLFRLQGKRAPVGQAFRPVGRPPARDRGAVPSRAVQEG